MLKTRRGIRGRCAPGGSRSGRRRAGTRRGRRGGRRGRPAGARGRRRGGGGRPARRRGRSSAARPAAGPETMPTATARFKVTIGFGASRGEQVVEARGSAASRCPRRARPRRGRRRSRPAAGTGRRGRTPARTATSRSPPRSRWRPRASGPAARAARARTARARGTAGVGQQHQRQQAGDLVLVGQQPPQHPRQPDRLARELDARQRLPERRGVALVEQQVEHVQDDVEALERSRERRAAHPTPSRATMRCAIVASATRNADAISAVVNPPTARSVSASWDGGDSDG